MCAPTLSDVTRAASILQQWKREWLEARWLGCTVERWLANETWEDVLEWMDENDAQRGSDCALFLRFGLAAGLDRIGRGCGAYLSTGTFFRPDLYERPTVEGRNAALVSRAGIYDGERFHDFDHLNVREDTSRSYYRGERYLHPWEGETDPIDPADGQKQGKYSWAKAPRYELPGSGRLPLEAGPLARQVIAGRPGAESYQDSDPLFLDIVGRLGSSVLVRVLARMHEACKYWRLARGWLDELDLRGRYYDKPEELGEGKGFGSTEAARGSLSDWIVLHNGKIENYQIVTPTAWNAGPRDHAGVLGPMEQSFLGARIADLSDPVEMGHVARSFDSCLVCTVHVYDGKSGSELSRFRVGEPG